MYELFDLGNGKKLSIARELLAQHSSNRDAFIAREMAYARTMTALTEKGK